MRLGRDGDRQPALGCAPAAIALALVAVVAIANAAWNCIAWMAGL